MAGPWKEVPLRGKPGAVAVLREWEEVDAGDRPVAVWWHEETARLWSILLPAIEREPLFHLQEEQTPSEWLEIQFERLEIHFRRPEIDFAWLEIHFG